MSVGVHLSVSKARPCCRADLPAPPHTVPACAAVDIWSGNHPFFQGNTSTVVTDEGRVNRCAHRGMRLGKWAHKEHRLGLLASWPDQHAWHATGCQLRCSALQQGRHLAAAVRPLPFWPRCSRLFCVATPATSSPDRFACAISPSRCPQLQAAVCWPGQPGNCGDHQQPAGGQEGRQVSLPRTPPGSQRLCSNQSAGRMLMSLAGRSAGAQQPGTLHARRCTAIARSPPRRSSPLRPSAFICSHFVLRFYL